MKAVVGTKEELPSKTFLGRKFHFFKMKNFKKFSSKTLRGEMFEKLKHAVLT